MAYTAATPLGSDKILTTQPRILGNFQFLPVGVGLEHNFNAAGTGSDMYHLQASMPNLGGIEPVVPPVAGTNGMYYVLGGKPKFVNASGNFFIQIAATAQASPIFLSGTVALTTTPATVTAVPTNSVGQYYLFSTTNSAVYAAGQFTSGNGLVSPGDLSGSSPGISLQGTVLNLQARVDNSGLAGNYQYVVVYYTP